MNTFPGLVHTARHVMKVGNTRNLWPNPLWEGVGEGGAGDWDEVVTREPYRKVRLDHLLSKEHVTRCVMPRSLSVCLVGGVCRWGCGVVGSELLRDVHALVVLVGGTLAMSHCCVRVV